MNTDDDIMIIFPSIKSQGCKSLGRYVAWTVGRPLFPDYLACGWIMRAERGRQTLIQRGRRTCERKIASDEFVDSTGVRNLGQ